jgi:hypothetical protein
MGGLRADDRIALYVYIRSGEETAPRKLVLSYVSSSSIDRAPHKFELQKAIERAPSANGLQECQVSDQ